MQNPFKQSRSRHVATRRFNTSKIVKRYIYYSPARYTAEKQHQTVCIDVPECATAICCMQHFFAKKFSFLPSFIVRTKKCSRGGKRFIFWIFLL